MCNTLYFPMIDTGTRIHKPRVKNPCDIISVHCVIIANEQLDAAGLHYISTHVRWKVPSIYLEYEDRIP